MSVRTAAQHSIARSGPFVPEQSRVDTDERRMLGREYERWVGMLRGRACPSIEDIEATGLAGPRQVLLDLRRNGEDPELTVVGGALVGECGRHKLRRLSDVPAGSYLSLLVAHHRQAAISRWPIAFEGEHVTLRGQRSSYRAILLPLASDGETVDFVYGAISWREEAEGRLSGAIEAQLEAILGRAAALGAGDAQLPLSA